MVDPAGQAPLATCFLDDPLFYFSSMLGAGGGYYDGRASAIITMGVCATTAASLTVASVQIQKETQKELYTVHFLSAKGDYSNNIIYVGRVKSANFNARMQYHSSRGRQLVSTITDLSYAACRGFEQAGMMYYHTINRGKALNNQIRGISPTNGNASSYFEAIYILIASGNYSSNNILPISYLLNQAENEFLNGGL